MNAINNTMRRIEQTLNAIKLAEHRASQVYDEFGAFPKSKIFETQIND
jgi:hypothetical protein